MDWDFLLPINIPLFRAPTLEYFFSNKLLLASEDTALQMGAVDFLSFVVFRHDNILLRASSLDKESWFVKLLQVWRCCNTFLGLCSRLWRSLLDSSAWISFLPPFTFVKIWSVSMGGRLFSSAILLEQLSPSEN